MKNLLFIVSAIFVSSAAMADIEPAYCQPSNFARTEVNPKMAASGYGILRRHSFRLGKTLFSGMAVGLSLPKSVSELATVNSDSKASEGYCTWYVNKYNPIAEVRFNWEYLSMPGANAQASATEYAQALDRSFDQNPVSFLSCMEKHHYLAIGCNNEQHRGPSVFAMILSFSGCTPEHSVALVNHYWGLNGVPLATRLAIAQKGYEMGARRPASRLKMSALFSGM